jgi:CopG family nickel-responsive transcriptional regulator
MKHGSSRFSVSIPSDLLRKFDRMITEKGYNNRSLAVADMARALLIEHRQQFDDAPSVGTITLVYDHHKPHVQEVLTEMQHSHLGEIVSTLHVHLENHHCMEVLVVRGVASSIKALANSLIGAKGVKHGKMTITCVGDDLPA